MVEPDFLLEESQKIYNIKHRQEADELSKIIAVIIISTKQV